MSRTDDRTLLAEMLERANIYYLRNNHLVEAFVSGEQDIALANLEMDSLAEMELCIGLEVDLGMELVPEDLRRVGTLENLAGLIADHRR